MTTSYQTEIAGYIDIAKRGKYILLVCVLASVIIGTAVAFTIPPVYESQATIYYLQTQIPDQMLVSFVNTYLEAAVQFIEATIFIRDKSLRIIKEVNLYPDLMNKLPADDVAVLLKEHYKSENIYTNISDAVGKTEEIMMGLKFSFEDRSPQKAFDVANILASEIIANYKKFRESFAITSTSFLIDEQQRLKEEMVKMDKKISDFKEKHINELPELFDANYRSIETLNQQLINMEQEFRLLSERKIMLESQLAQIQPTSPLEGLSGEKIVSPEEKLESLKAELAVLQTKFSDKHPDIIRVKREIPGLEKIVSARKQDTNTQNDIQRKKSPLKQRMESITEMGAYNPTYVNFVTQIEETDAQIQSLDAQKEKIRSELLKYKERIERTPLIEKEYNALSRDLESAKGRFDELSRQALLAGSSAEMEKREVGGQLVLSEPPSFPLRPVRPNRMLIIGAAPIIGIVAGILIIFSLEFLNQKVRTPLDVSKVSTFPVLLELPEIPRYDQKKTRNVRKLAIPLIILIMVPVVLFAINYYKPLELDITIIRIMDIIKKQFILLGQ